MNASHIKVDNPDLDLLARKKFLTESWKSYPNYVKTNGSVVGRITAFTKGGFYIYGESHLFPLFGKDLSPWAKILTLGDIVAFEKSEQYFKNFTLLTAQVCDDQKAIADFQSLAKKRKHHLKWTQFLSDVQNFFLLKDFIQAQTPSLVDCPGTEPSLDPFFTEINWGSQKMFKTLPTSPELHLKKLLAAGYENIFELKNCFRNNEITEIHQPEFMMLEWYRSYSSLGDIEVDAVELISRLDTQKKFTAPERLSVSQLFEKYADFKLRPDSDFEDLRLLCQRHEISVSADDSWNDLFHRVWVEKIDPSLKNHSFLIVNQFPPLQAALAKINSYGWADRFEIYLNGVEIANAFLELNDPAIQRERFEKDLAEKSRLGKKSISLDAQFINALEYGMPPSAGIALGLDRLFMVTSGFKSITEFKLFPISASAMRP